MLRVTEYFAKSFKVSRSLKVIKTASFGKSHTSSY